MHTPRVVGVGAALAVVLCCSIAVYATFDRYAPSASYELQDYFITMAPVWLGTIIGAWVWLHPVERPHDDDDEPGHRRR